MKEQSDGRWWICGGDLKLGVGPQPVNWQNTHEFVVENCPVLFCPDCNYVSSSRPAVVHIEHMVKEMVDHGDEPAAPSFDDIAKMKMAPINGIKFDSDMLDNFISPLVYHKGGSLTPIYFEQSVLGKYRTAGHLQMIGDTHGRVQLPDGTAFSFGINRKGTVFVWYSELLGLSEKELTYLKSFNTESDNDVASDYHEALLGRLALPQETKEATLFRVRSEFKTKFGISLGASFEHLGEEGAALIDSFVAPVSFDGQSISYGFVDLNNIVVETIHTEPLRSALKTFLPDKELSGKRGLKLWELVLEHVFQVTDARALLTPFAMLYELRQLKPHLLPEDRRREIIELACTNLQLPPDSSLLTIYETVIIRMCHAYYRLIEIVEEANRWAREHATHGDIAAVAHSLWEKRGRGDGNDLADWFAAERQVLAEMILSRFKPTVVGAKKK